MKSYVHLNTFDGRAKFSTWLTRIVINSAPMTLRRKRAHPETSMEITDGEVWQPREIADQTKNAEELYARNERTERLRRAICRLPPSLRNVVEIHQSNDRSIKEIAKIAGLSVAATKSRLLRARAALRRDLVERPEKQWRSSQKGIDECSIRLGRHWLKCSTPWRYERMVVSAKLRRRNPSSMR
ncbi:MAG: polymerase sigma-70 factor, subfamily [Acidobacteriaceae bacterium]|nr:polymerase sigma-70 factor, subfamily [Acidobacteriaceae bacterium]